MARWIFAIPHTPRLRRTDAEKLQARVLPESPPSHSRLIFEIALGIIHDNRFRRAYQSHH